MSRPFFVARMGLEDMQHEEKEESVTLDEFRPGGR